ncbi:MazG nucleotide pyrophosphohydrolase domain-containing protein [Fluviispira vulneris]|uniref:MazG nucleotide pyrophosphohydrolase domain-containing protein n=1 Tax=Fluviispira vulneris TaxID=2763012 RepID=UPI001646CE8B|nr:MazG-like family protein [Fluviispira vulneris]
MNFKNKDLTLQECVYLVNEHLGKIGYYKIEKTPEHAFMHLIEEVGELSRALSYEFTDRKSLKKNAQEESVSDELADVFWQVIKLSLYLKIDLNEAFCNKYRKNLAKGFPKESVL